VNLPKAAKKAGRAVSLSRTISSPSKPVWAVPYYVKGLALGIPPYLVAIHMWTWLLIVPASLKTTGYDFRQLYAAAFMVRTGHANELYEYEFQKEIQNQHVSWQEQALPFVSPAYEALVASPLSLFPFGIAYFLFLAVNLIALMTCFILLRPWMTNLHAVFRWLPIALFLGFLPVAVALIEGQDSILLTTALVSSFVLLTKHRNLVAGFMTGLALFKFPIVLPVAALFLLRGRWRFLAGFAISGAAVVWLSIFLTGMSQTRLYVESLAAISGITTPTSALALYPVEWQKMANLHGLVFGLAGTWIPPARLQVLTILLSMAIFGWIAFRGRRVDNAYALLLMAIPCSVLIGHHTYIHDLSVLLLPTIILLNKYLPAEAGGDPSERLIGRSAALMFVSPILVSFAFGHFYIVAIAVLLLLAASSTAAREPNSVAVGRL
jgi:Glycosyltransferase family 87